MSCILVGKILSATTFLCIPTSVLQDKAFHTTDVVFQCQCSWSSYAGFISQIYPTILECSVPHRKLFPNHHVLPLDSNKFSVNWVHVFFLMHARTKLQLTPPCWYNFPVSKTLPLPYTYVHKLNRYLAVSTSINDSGSTHMQPCSSGCYNRHSYYLTSFWYNTDTGHSFSQAALTCTLLPEQPLWTHIHIYDQ